jgi:hypothetical protein
LKKSRALFFLDIDRNTQNLLIAGQQTTIPEAGASSITSQNKHSYTAEEKGDDFSTCLTSRVFCKRYSWLLVFKKNTVLISFHASIPSSGDISSMKKQNSNA